MTTTTGVTKVKRGKLLSADEAGALLGISGQQLRLWIRMKLLHADCVGRSYIIQSEQLALTSKRYHDGYFTDAPCGRDGGSINRIELE